MQYLCDNRAMTTIEEAVGTSSSPNLNGMGNMHFLPLIAPLIGAAATLIPALMSKKDKGPKGPSKAEIAAAQAAADAAMQKEKNKKLMIYVGAGLGVVALIFGVYVISRRRD